MRRSKLFLSLSLALILTASLSATPTRAGEGDTYYFPFFHDFSKRVGGVYLVTGVPPQGPPFLLLFDVYREGMFSSTAQVQGTNLSGFAFTDDQGIWKQSGTLQITARLLSFNYVPPGTEPPAGNLHSNGIADIVVNFDEDFDDINGTFNVTVFPPNVNPLDPEAVPLGPPLEILFEGQRLTIP